MSGIAITISLLAAMQHAPAASLEDRQRVYDSGHFSDAKSFWAELNTRGSAEAAYGLGLLNDLGNGTPEDPVAAFFWYQVAAEASLPVAEFNVGIMYDSGQGVGRDPRLAAIWYAKAAAHGHLRAQFNLGSLYEHGDGVPKNPAVAAAWLKLAYRGGASAAGTHLKALKAALAQTKAGEPRHLGPSANVDLVWPNRNAGLIKLPERTIEFVWIPPQGSADVRYHLQIRLAGAHDQPLIHSALMSETAALVVLPKPDAAYIWKVDMVKSDHSVRPGDWSRFSVESAGYLATRATR